MSEGRWYPSVQDVLEIHDDIVSEYSDTTPGVQTEGDIEFALQFIREGGIGERPATIHEKAFHLLRLLVANHPFVDGNKRTALNTVTVFYLLNGYRFDYDDEVRTILKEFGIDETGVDEDQTLDYLRAHTTEVDLADVVAEWQDDLVEHGLDQLAEESRDPND